MEWQRLELGAYSADLPIWSNLAAEHSDRVMELGAGAGRVTFHLCESGHEVIAIESHTQLADHLMHEANARDLPLEVVQGAAEAVAPKLADPGLIIAPMQFFHYLAPETAFGAFRRTAGPEITSPLIGLAILQDRFLQEGRFALDLLPDMVDSGGLILSSRVRRVEISEDQIVIERQRETVSPKGEREIELKYETLWRYDQKDVELIFEGLGYSLRESADLPEEPGMMPSTLLVFEPVSRRSPR